MYIINEIYYNRISTINLINPHVNKSHKMIIFKFNEEIIVENIKEIRNLS